MHVCSYCKFSCYIIYFFLCYPRHLTWYHPWRLSRFPFYFISIGTLICVTIGNHPGFLCSGISIVALHGATLGSLTGLLFAFAPLELVSGVAVALWGYQCITCERPWYGSIFTSNPLPLCLLVDIYYASLGMILNNYARFINAVWCVSLIVTKGPFGVGFCDYYTKSSIASVVASAYKTLIILTFWVGNSTMSAIFSGIVSATNNL